MALVPESKTHPPERAKKKKRFTYVLGNSNDYRHCSGINSVKMGRSAEDIGKDFLFTGSRDGTVKSWELGPNAITFGATFESHTDWVNDAVLLGVDTMVSCSSDTTLKTWRAFANPECTRTFRQHKDYVMSLAVARHSNNIVASGGLCCELFLWDLEAAMTPVSRASTEGLEESTRGENLAASAGREIDNHPILAKCDLTANQKAKGNKKSIYAVSINDAGTMLVSGGTEKDIRVWDPRTGTKQMKLKGQTHNVRSLILDPTGRLCISGSSDRMIRLWDIGQQSCVHSYAVHTDSVWALTATPSFSHVYSGGRDKSVFVTDLRTRESELVCLEEHPILQVELQGEDSLWVATEDSLLKKWPVADKEYLRHIHQKASSNVAGSSQLTSASKEHTEEEHPLQSTCESTSTAVIPGTPAIVQSVILKDRHHVVTRDSAGVVKRWEITRGTVVNDYGVISFKEKVNELSLELSEMVDDIPAWFTIDTKLGSLSVHLDAPQCFSAEVHTVDMQILNAPAKVKLNLGKETLRGILAHWIDQRRHQVANASSSNPDVSTGSLNVGGEEEKDKKGKGHVVHQSDNADNQAEYQHTNVLPAFQFSATSPPLIITEGSEGGQWRKRSTDLDGKEDEQDLPLWCIECVLGGSPPPTREAKISPVFQLSEDTRGDTLEALLQKFTRRKISTLEAANQLEAPQISQSEYRGTADFRFRFPHLEPTTSQTSYTTHGVSGSEQIKLQADADEYTNLEVPRQIPLQRMDTVSNSPNNAVIDIDSDYYSSDGTSASKFSIRSCLRGLFSIRNCLRGLFRKITMHIR